LFELITFESKFTGPDRGLGFYCKVHIRGQVKYASKIVTGQRKFYLLLMFNLICMMIC